jgi:hypothetical protein
MHDDRLATHRGVKRTDADIHICSIHYQFEPTWMPVYVMLGGAFLALVPFIPGIPLPFGWLFMVPTISATTLNLVGISVLTALWYTVCCGLILFGKAALEREQNTTILYSPHAVSCVVSEFSHGCTSDEARATVRQKLLRLATLPLSDSIAAQVLDGSEQAALAVLDSQVFQSRTQPPVLHGLAWVED